MRTLRTLAVLCMLASLSFAQTAAPSPNQGATPQQPEPEYNENQNTTPATQNNQDPQAPVLATRDQATTTQARSGGQIAVGTEVRAALDERLSSENSQVGDRFTATITEPVRSAGGAVAIPAGAKIEGEITQAEEGKTAAAIRGRGRLNLRFREVVLPDGVRVPFRATLVSLHKTSGDKVSGADVEQEGDVESRTSTTRAARDVAIGAGIGTIAGLIFGEPLKGAVIGAVAGGGYVLAKGGQDVELAPNTGMVLRVDNVVNVPAPTGTR